MKWFVTSMVVVLLVGCEPSMPPEAEERSFGHRQIEQLLADRPDMRGLIERGGPIWEWVAEGFDGDRTGYRIHWVASTPRSGREAESGFPYEGYPGIIAISGGTEATPVDRWASLIFELINHENCVPMEALRDQVLAFELDGEGYADGCNRLEWEAINKATEFFAKHPLPESRHGRDRFYTWVRKGVGSYAEYRARDSAHPSVLTSNYLYFLEYYETVLEPWRSRGPQPE